jgi:hypothetical protein
MPLETKARGRRHDAVFKKSAVAQGLPYGKSARIMAGELWAAVNRTRLTGRRRPTPYEPG